MTVGIPRAFLYYKYSYLWETFFETLGVPVVLSGPTDKAILTKGTMYAIDEACLSSKIFLGHVDALLGKCDAIFVPRISNFGRREILCTKFEALYDIVANTFRDKKIELLDYNIDLKRSKSEMSAFLALGKKLGKKKPNVFFAYMAAKQAEKNAHAEALRAQSELLEKDGIKILLVGHSYNLYDELIGKPVLNYLKELGATPILADIADKKRAALRAIEVTDNLPWIYNKELVGAVQEYKARVDGMILLSAFPCGPDSLVNEILLRRVKTLPTLTLLLDSQEGNAGLETRLESFIDIIRFKKEGSL